MPIVKYIPVHQSPLKFIKYIMQSGKTDFLKYATGLNCTENVQDCYTEMSEVFENASGERFYKRSLNGEENKRERIRLHHYIQSFAPGEADSKLAHKIGVEWAQEVFGKNRQVMVTTHIDRGHLHNHFAVAEYDLEGKIWYGNKKSLKRCREISDHIAEKYKLSIIEKPQYRANQKYGEWLAGKNGTSWKQKLCDDINKLILSDAVQSVDDLVKELRKIGYEVNHGKYISIKAVKNRKSIRSFRLDNGYAIEELKYRIENKDKEMSLAALMRYEGIQRDYALCLRELQIMVYTKAANPVQANYRTLRQNADLLTFLCDKKISSLSEFENAVNEAAENFDEADKKKKELEKQIELESKIISDSKRYLEIMSIEYPTAAEMKEFENYEYLSKHRIESAADIEARKQKLSKLKSELSIAEENLAVATAEKKECGSYYSTYLKQMQSDYDRIFEKAKREKEEMEQAAEFYEQEQIEQRKRNYR